MKPDFLPDLDTARRLVLELDLLGVRLGTSGTRVTYDAPKGVLTEEVKDRLKVNKHIVHALLLQRAEATRDSIKSPAPRPRQKYFRTHCPYPHHTDWLSIHGVRVCRMCHPPAAPELVAKELA